MTNKTSSQVSRREFLQHSVVTTSGMVLGLGLASAECADAQGKTSHAKIPIGLQLYTLRDQCKDDLPGMLTAVSGIGFRAVEFAGYYGRNAKQLRVMLDDNGLIACGTHTPYDSVLGDRLKATIEFNRIIGNKFVIVPYMTANSKQEWLDRAKLFNELSDKVRAEGMWIGYHAHAHDFQKFDGESAWDLFFGNTKPEVIMQLDTCNCCQGGADPVAVLKKYPGRARTIHIKPFSTNPEAVIGEDTIAWSQVFAFCEGPGKTDWYVVEHETSKDPLGTAKRTFEVLKKMGKA
jgi:sugar phosphate isomerase/epimerase